MRNGLLLVAFLGGLILSTESAASAAHPLSMNDMFALQRLSDPQISPDGKSVAYVVAVVDKEKNASTSTIWLVPTDGGAPRQLTGGPKHDRHPRFSPDGSQLLFESDRSGENQLWVLELGGGEARQLTTIATEASTGVWSPDGKSIAFVSGVYPEFSDKPYAESNAANKKRKEEIEKNPVKARVFDKLFFRHWDSWVEGKRQHLFIMPAAGGEPRDLTPGDTDAYPTSTTFSLGDDFTFTPDSSAIVYTAPAVRDEAWSTNHDLYRVPVAGGKPENLTADNPAADTFPRFSPDGKWLAYRAQAKAGSEADRWQLMLMPAAGGKPRSLTAKQDRSIDAFVWANNDTIYSTSERNAGMPICKIAIKDGAFMEVASGGAFGSLSISKDGKQLAATHASMNAPAEIVLLDTASGKLRNLTDANKALLADLTMNKPESVTVKGAGGTPMQMWILKPPGFDANKKWPLVYLVHGGPQGAWEDAWSYRWNPQLWAAQGYVVAMPNPRGSTGFGQQYVDEISGDWGGKCFDDLMAGVAYLEKLPFIDSTRMAAAGASFGGYMMNWFEGHTDKFKTLITHCGVYNFDSMYSTTEELWFDEWEHGGPPWVNRESYEKFSPHLFAKNFKTPMLVIHNDQDFRVPIGEGLMMFTTLQRLGIPSRMVNFPDEGHWVLKPANSEYWHKEVFDWLKKYVPPGPKS
jgi:dipeptidyl aminopeptidase/acylaminoacyl peptidase